MRLKLFAVGLLVIVAPGIALANEDTNAYKQNDSVVRKTKKVKKSRADAAKKTDTKARNETSPAAAESSDNPIENWWNGGPLTWHGITLYGNVDAGVNWASHGLRTIGQQSFPIAIANKSGNHAMFQDSPNNLSYSNIGLKGKEDITPDLSVVFDMRTDFNPFYGVLADGPGSLTKQNGAVYATTANADSARAGQPFNNIVYGGISQTTFGTITAGRQNSLFLDNIAKYDPAVAANAYSVIGYSGVAGGGGNTEDTRLDDSIKYRVNIDPLHFGAMYKFSTHGLSNETYQFNAGGKIENLEVDFVYGMMRDSIAAGYLTTPAALYQYVTTNKGGSSSTLKGQYAVNDLAATTSNNHTFQVAAKYAFQEWKLFAGYEHIIYAPPSININAGASGLGGYTYSTVNNNAYYYHNKLLQILWGGVKYTYNGNLDLTLSYYHYIQNSYGKTACYDTSAGACSGYQNALSFYMDYRVNKKLDFYAGVMRSSVSNGLANAYLYNTLYMPSAGVRYQF